MLSQTPRGACMVALLGLAACSGSSAPASRSGSARPSGGLGAAAATADPASGAGAAATDNPATALVPARAAIGGSGAAQPQTPVSKSSGRDPITVDQCSGTNPAGLSDADVHKLQAGGATPGNMKWLYPYDGTVFPRGMLAPLLMWDGGMADAVYVHIQSKAFDYKGCLKPTAAGQLQLAQDIWDQAGHQTFGADDPYTLELSALHGGVAAGPISLQLKIAQATTKGSIYYNSYSSKLDPGMSKSTAGGFGAQGAGGMVLRIPAGGTASVFASNGCNGCHSVSADGSRLISQYVPGDGASFALTQGVMANPPSAKAGPRAAFGAFYPDGSKFIATSVAIEVARSLMTEGQGAPQDATLYDASSGMVVPNHGIPAGALMPMLAPDGSLLAFNDNAIDMAHGIAIMKYDVTSDTASDYKVLVKEPAGSMRPGWPFILPDNGGVVFVRTDGTDFSGNGAGVMSSGFGGGGQGTKAPFSDLSIADVKSGTVTLLARAMGYAKPEDASSDTTYLPFGAEELHHNYFPTVSPVAAGGYFWMFFDSVRHYGNLGEGRQLWGAAIDIQADGTYKLDPSHPAFYLPGQEFGTGNHRAFAALDPCKKEGDSCTSGIDCCGGYCYIDGPEEFVDPVGTCTPKKKMCSARDERCVTDADCCPPMMGEPANTCIAGYCAFVPVLN